MIFPFRLLSLSSSSLSAFSLNLKNVLSLSAFSLHQISNSYEHNLYHSRCQRTPTSCLRSMNIICQPQSSHQRALLYQQWPYVKNTTLTKRKSTFSLNNGRHIKTNICVSLIATKIDLKREREGWIVCIMFVQV